MPFAYPDLPGRSGTSPRPRPPPPPSSPSRGRTRTRSQTRPRSRSRSRQPTTPLASTAPLLSTPGVQHIQLSPPSHKPRQLAHLTYNLTAPPNPPPAPSAATLDLCRQWRHGQYRPAPHQTHHCGAALGWASAYASADRSAAAEPLMDKAWRARWSCVAAGGVTAGFAPAAHVPDSRPPRPDFTYGFTGSAFGAAQRAVVDGLPDATRVLEVGREPLFPFFFQAWVDDGGSRREAEVEMARAGVAAVKALREFYAACGVEEVDVVDTVVFSAVVSPEMCRVFVHWAGEAPESGKVQYEVDKMCMAMMEDANGVENIRRVFEKMKRWARDVRLERLKEVVDYADDLALRANLREMEMAYEESLKNLEATKSRGETASNGPYESEEKGEVEFADTATAERKDSVTLPDVDKAGKIEAVRQSAEEHGVQADTPRFLPQTSMIPPPSMSLNDIP
ncbi:hypothetical protein BKCO1_4000173 [Neofusicoccum parvum]|uniref:Uncharacterized protein n=1 Tax=Neofusicoccum parvum TaxID=310453 RepID=A0ACB5RYE0_9PEZI|nr:hypothetical protein BKCO1_4000173 [Neofusicoccum parvum]